MQTQTDHIQKELERKIEAAFQAGIRQGKKLAATRNYCAQCDEQFDELIASTDKHLQEAKMLIRELRGIPAWLTDAQFEEIVDLPEAEREAYYLANSPYFQVQLQRTRKTEIIGGVRI